MEIRFHHYLAQIQDIASVLTVARGLFLYHQQILAPAIQYTGKPNSTLFISVNTRELFISLDKFIEFLFTNWTIHPNYDIQPEHHHLLPEDLMFSVNS